MVKAKQNTKKNTSRRGKKRGGWFRFLRALPAWSIWFGALAIACAYAFLFYYFFVGPLSFRWRAIYGDAPTPDGYEVRGIDISHYQDQVNWEQLRNSKVNGVPLRFVISKATEGEKMIDENFNDNFYRARENGLIRGAYHYYKANVSSERQARFFLKQVHLQPGDLPPILDVEERGLKSTKSFQRDVKLWLDMVEQEYGVKPIIYTGYKFRMDYLNDSTFNAYPYWIAHYYVKELAYKGEWSLWQYTDCGKVDGIRGMVDCNIFNGDLSALSQFCIPEDRD